METDEENANQAKQKNGRTSSNHRFQASQLCSSDII